VTPLLQLEPLQHDSPGPPQEQVPFTHVRLLPQVAPLQHGSPDAPQATHAPPSTLTVSPVQPPAPEPELEPPLPDPPEEAPPDPLPPELPDDPLVVASGDDDVLPSGSVTVPVAPDGALSVIT
jgi:hypothetical protein